MEPTLKKWLTSYSHNMETYPHPQEELDKEEAAKKTADEELLKIRKKIEEENLKEASAKADRQNPSEVSVHPLKRNR